MWLSSHKFWWHTWKIYNWAIWSLTKIPIWNILFRQKNALFSEWQAFWLSTMACKVYKPSTHVLILITLPVRLQQLAGKKSQTSQRIIMRKIGFALALIVFTIFIQVRPRICNHLNYLFVYQNKPPILNLQILIFSHEIGFSFWSAQTL